jgi:hypothetical protein
LKDHYSNYWTIRVGKENKCLFSGTATGHQQQGTGRKNLIQTSLATAVEIRGDEKYAGDCRSVPASTWLVLNHQLPQLAGLMKPKQRLKSGLHHYP